MFRQLTTVYDYGEHNRLLVIWSALHIIHVYARVTSKIEHYGDRKSTPHYEDLKNESELD
ncbi:MAG TPA: hypothetical protein VGK06_12805 [Methanosarcina sp.]